VIRKKSTVLRLHLSNLSCWFGIRSKWWCKGVAVGKDYSDVARLHSNLNDNKWVSSVRLMS